MLTTLKLKAKNANYYDKNKIFHFYTETVPKMFMELI